MQWFIAGHRVREISIKVTHNPSFQIKSKL